MLTFHEKYYLIIVLNNWIAAMRQKKLAQVKQKVGKVVLQRNSWRNILKPMS